MSLSYPLRAAPQDASSLEQSVRVLSGARAVRVRDAPGALIAEHSHDWPVLSLYVLGSHTKLHESGETLIARPSAVLHPLGVCHANRVGKAGLEQLDIEFDPAWLKSTDGVRLGWGQVRCWIGGIVANAARGLAAEWRRSGRSEAALRMATRRFFQTAFRAPEPKAPAWIGSAQTLLAADSAMSTTEIARRLHVSPAWFTQAYRAAMGEGVSETQQRLRVERAVLSLHAGVPAAEAAAAAGFCDQSHMIRTFRRVLDRTPAEIQAEVQVAGA